ncbi:MAG: hypothetical protein BJ554DRAFT_3241, partial [Olpidium bornovanus]
HVSRKQGTAITARARSVSGPANNTLSPAVPPAPLARPEPAAEPAQAPAAAPPPLARPSPAAMRKSAAKAAEFSPPQQQEPEKFATALYDFDAQNDDELRVHENDLVVVIDDSETEWWKCRLVETGEEGVVPATYLELAGGGVAGSSDGAADAEAELRHRQQEAERLRVEEEERVRAEAEEQSRLELQRQAEEREQMRREEENRKRETERQRQAQRQKEDEEAAAKKAKEETKNSRAANESVAVPAVKPHKVRPVGSLALLRYVSMDKVLMWLSGVAADAFIVPVRKAPVPPALPPSRPTVDSATVRKPAAGFKTQPDRPQKANSDSSKRRTVPTRTSPIASRTDHHVD